MLLIILQNNCDGFWAWPWPLILAFLLGLLLGWLLSKLFGSKDATCENCAGIQAELDACRANAKLLKDNSSKITAKTTTETIAAASLVAKVDDSVKDNLTKVEGIGPKIQEHFNNGGIWSWKQLSNAKVSRLQEILDNAGPRYRIHNPETWPMQAGMCANGEWDKLKTWQDEHKGGRA